MVLSQMYNVDIVIIRQDFVWLSRAIAAITCGIVLVQDSSGNFLGTKTKNPVYIGLVPKISLPDLNVIRAKLHEIRHQSTPNRPIRSQNEAFRKFGGGLSLIVENSSRKFQANKEVVVRQNLLGEDSSSSTSASTSLLRRNIRQFEEQNLSQIWQKTAKREKICLPPLIPMKLLQKTNNEMILNQAMTRKTDKHQLPKMTVKKCQELLM